MLQPQSDDEIQPVIEALRRLDPLLSVRWNPKAVLLTTGSYTALGKATDPTYDGRWEVIRFETATKMRDDRDWALICTVTAPVEYGGTRCMVDVGAYAPIGAWLVEFMHAADAANAKAFAALRDRIHAEDDRRELAKDSFDDAAGRNALDRVHFDAVYAGGVGNWMGRGADFGSPSPLILP